MTTNINAVKVLCYGDSNTWGYTPVTKKRYDINTRWTGILQNLLTDSFEIIEEGLNGRTINVDDPEKFGKNGKTYLQPCIESHNPIDILILYLGTNDMKDVYNKTAEDIANSIEELVDIIKSSAKDNDNNIPKIILLSPTLIDFSNLENIKLTPADIRYSKAETKSKRLGELYKQIAEKNKFYFLNLASITPPSNKDGYHLEKDAHILIAKSLYNIIINEIK